MASRHRFLKFILSGKAFAAVRDGTREWLIECKCGYRRDFWDLGGVRYKAAGEPRQYVPCPRCGKATWHKIRKKTDEEKKVIRGHENY